MALGTATRTATETATRTVTDALPQELRFDAGRICLDLLSTTHPEERLGSLPPLRAWIMGAGLVPPGTALGHADLVWLAEFRELRSCIAQLVRGHLDGPPWPEPRARDLALALARVNEAARAAPPAPRAVRGADGTLLRALAAPPGRAAVLAAVARDALDLLTDPVARAALRRCAGDNCPIVYLDTSRGRRRRWCSSEVCGNRERVARHRRRAALART
ncbi:CGNR zinc finger domain-containing protein [Streptomyces sp. NRRL S-340]|uniref:CGNR zinc finger domain-containing protein n=1 Tax=Streptomyces sp. NRRL S-340 TaxID=1463901 RepID=UPI00099B2FEF|nr:CGNR zinc finger domain-containing protein [Streptomyces sp. NRRL S-340]